MVKMNPKTILTNILLLLLFQISNLSTIVFSLEPYYKKPYKPGYTRRPGILTRVVVSNELYDLKKGNAGFVCAHGPKVWRKSKPGDRYILIEFEHTGVKRYKYVHCHLRSARGYVNVTIYLHADTSALCYPSFVCRYVIREDGVYYKPEKRLFPWLPYPRSKKGGHPKA